MHRPGKRFRIFDFFGPTRSPVLPRPWPPPENENASQSGPWEAFTYPGANLLSRLTHYHRPLALNGRVRDGNGCGRQGVRTGKSHVYEQGSGSVAIVIAACPREGGVNAAK